MILTAPSPSVDCLQVLELGTFMKEMKGDLVDMQKTMHTTEENEKYMRAQLAKEHDRQLQITKDLGQERERRKELEGALKKFESSAVASGSGGTHFPAINIDSEGDDLMNGYTPQQSQSPTPAKT